MIYFIQATIYAALLYIVYLLFMKNRTSHLWSRAYLLLNMALPFVLPFISIAAFQNQNTAITTVMLPVVNIGTEVTATAEKTDLLPIIHIAISFAMFGYLVAQAVQLMLFIRRNKAEKVGNIKLLRGTGMGPGSWFNYVFIPDENADDAVMKHEMAHVQYGHSYDIVLSRLGLCFAWPNAMFWLILNELKTVHEFEADAAAGKDSTDYGQSLLNELFHTKHFALSHTFFHHPIKRRIMMLQKNSSTGKFKVVTLALLMLTGILYARSSGDGNDNGSRSAQADANGVYNQADKMPEWTGSNFLAFHMPTILKYPQAAKEKKIEGKVVVKFYIDENGKLQDPQVVSSPDQLLSDAALSAVKQLSTWKAGEQDGKKVKVYYTLPINFIMAFPESTPDNPGPYDHILGKNLVKYPDWKTYPVYVAAEPREGC
ncbi:MAG TPA: M56 family metallopeptidase [Flavipsychrobacter sp.]|nr:M56 family metallopeptidase [Flavipsychrobacter sp.]